MDLLHNRAWFVYEAARAHAIASEAPVVPESWAERDDAFREQFLKVIEHQCGPEHSSSPEELHEQWVQAYLDMGWKYGEVRDPKAKTHPDMVPFQELEIREQNKDIVFIALCEIAANWIVDIPEEE